MAVVGNLLQFIIGTRVDGVADRILNTFYYDLIALSGTTNLAGNGQSIADAWRDVHAAAWSNVIHPAGFVTDVTINNLTNELEFFQGEFTTPIGGSVTGQILPLFMAWGFKFSRTTRQTRNGAKRISPLGEDQLTSSAPTPAAVTALDALAEIFGETLSLEDDDGSVLTLQPVIVRQDTGFGDIRNAVSSVSFLRVTTQNTRKPGRGM